MLALAASAAWAVPDPNDDPLGQFLAARAGEAPQVAPVAPAEIGRAGEKAADMVLAALNFLDVPYRRGGNSAETGLDCSGLVRTLYTQTMGLVLPRRAEEQAAATEKIDRKELKPGEEVDTFICTDYKDHIGRALENYTGDLLWRVQVRRGLIRVRDRDISATAVIGVEFRTQDVEGL